MKELVVSIALIMNSLSICSQPFSYPKDNPAELGKVDWKRNYDDAITRANNTEKPIFILFQEVPGCSNCTAYGNSTLSHPLIVEAIEDLYVPLAIYNNKGGHDREILDHFGEPSWNNPVVRIVDSKGTLLSNRISNFRSSAEVVKAMIDGLTKSGHNVPIYLELLREELTAQENGMEEIFLSMYCFWTGEKEIAKIEGVIGTEAGYMHDREVVKVSFAQNRTDLQQIANNAEKVKCADEIYVKSPNGRDNKVKKIGRYRKDNQDKYYLLQSKYQTIPMTEYQKTKVNSAIGSGQNPEIYLSPRQIKLLNWKKANKNLISESFSKAWYSLCIL
jgi:hypothetical protein